MRHQKVAAILIIVLGISLIQFAAAKSYSQSRRIEPSARVETRIGLSLDDCPTGQCSSDPVTRLKSIDASEKEIATMGETPDSDQPGCDPSYRSTPTTPPLGAVLGVPTIAPPRPTPIHPLTSRFDVPTENLEVVQVTITLETAQ